MGSQGPGRKRTPSKNGLTGEEDALNVIAQEAEARLAAKRAARAEAREIRMRELERQQKEVSDDEERMSVGSKSNIRVDDRPERDYLEKGSSRASTISGATLTSLGGTSSRRGSGDTSISADTEASIREIKEIHELKDQIQDVEAKHMQNLKELKDSLLEVEEKYRKAMVSNAQLDNEKTNMMYEVDTLKDSLMELEEMLYETRRELEEKTKDLEREKHAHSILQFQFSELKETLKQSEELLTKHGIVIGLDLATNGETGEEVGNAEQNSQTASAEIREGSSVLGTHQLTLCKDQQQKDLDDRMQENQQTSHAPFSSTKTAVEANGGLGDKMIQGVEQLENKPEEPPSSVVGDELTATRPNEKIKSEAHLPENSKYDTEQFEGKVHNQQESEGVKPSKDFTEETPLDSVSGPIHDETDKPGEAVLDDQFKIESVESSQMEKLPKTQGASASNTKKKKKKKKNKQKQKQSDRQVSDTRIDDRNEMALCEDNPNHELEDDLEENHQKALGNDVSETTMNTDVPHVDKGTNELDYIEVTSTNINADDSRDKIQLVTDEADLAEMSKTISNSDCPESSSGVLSDDLSNTMSNPGTITDDHTEDSTNPDPEPVIFSELMPSVTETSLPHEPSVQPVDAVGVCVEPIISPENIENSSLLGVKEEKSHLDCDVEEQKERLQNIDLDGDTKSEDQDNSAHSSSPVMEKVENESENIIQEQPVDQPMEIQLQDSVVADMNQEAVETQDELDEENLNASSENMFDGCHVDDTPLLKTQMQVIPGDHLSANEVNQESVVESAASDQELKVEKIQEEISIQDQVTLNVELPEDEEDLLVKSDVVLQELKDKDEEEDDGESFDFDEMDLEASSDAPLKNFVDPPIEDSALLKEKQEVSQEYQMNAKNEDQTQEGECLEHADQELKPKEHKDDGHVRENTQTAMDVERCLTEDSQINSEVRPNDQEHDTPDVFEEHHQASEDVTPSKGVSQSSEMETRDVGQEIDSAIHHEDKALDNSGEPESTGISKDDRKESKKSGKNKGKGKGKEECKMS